MSQPTTSAITNDLYYSVFCVSVWMLTNKICPSEDLDICWYNAVKFYKEFVESPYNSDSKSELDCINDFMVNKFQKK